MKNNKSILLITLSLILTCSVYANNNIKPTKEDDTIANSIKILMDVDPLVNASDITVSSVNKNVKLKGTTNSRTQYEEAVSLAHTVDNVKSVDTSSLKIKKSKSYAADSYITGKIKGKLIANKVLETHQANPFYVSVETVNGNVYLTGVVADRNQAISAISSAYDVKGVQSVTSYLKMSNPKKAV